MGLTNIRNSYLKISGISYTDEKDKSQSHYSGIIEAYYKCGEYQKANAILLEFSQILLQDMRYYQALESRFKRRYENEAFQSQSLYNELIRLAQQYKQDAILSQIK